MKLINRWRIWLLIPFFIQSLALDTIYCRSSFRDSESDYSPNFSEKQGIDSRKFSFLLYTIISQVLTESSSSSSEIIFEYSKNLKNLSDSIIQDFDNCDKILTDEIPHLFLPFITSPNIEHGHNIAYEVCCRLRSSISANSELNTLLGNSTKYLDNEDFVKTSMEAINKFDISSDIPAYTTGLVYGTTLDHHKGITSNKDKLRNLPYQDDIGSENETDSSSSGMIFSFDVKAAPFMNSNTQQYIYVYYHHSDNSKCLGLTKKQLEMVETIQKVSVNAKDVQKIPLDIACTSMWFISQRWDFCPLVFKQLMEIKGSSSIKFCDMVKRAATERTKFITKTLKISDSFLTTRAIKILNYVETVLKLNSKYFPDSEITSKDIADIIYKGDSDIFVEENEDILLKELRRNRAERKFNTNKELPKNNRLGLSYPNYRRDRHNFTSIFDHIMYSENNSHDYEGENLLLLPLEFKRSPHWTSDKHLGSNSKEVVSSTTVLQKYYIPPPSSLIPNDVSNWITGPCCWLEDKYKHLPSLIISISKRKGYKLHVLNACEAIFTLINDSGESCASILVSAVFLIFSLENFSEASDICSEAAIRASLPFYPEKHLKSTLFPTNKYELVTLYEAIVVALCLELGIVLDNEDIHQIIFSDYPTNNSLVPRSALNYLLYRALKLPNDFGKVRGFWNWSTQMYTRISNKQAKVILTNRATQLTLEIAQVTNEIEIMNDILEKAKKDPNVLQQGVENLNVLKHNKEMPKINYLHHYNYDFKLANFNSIEVNLVKLERLRYDLTIEKEKISKYINSLSAFIGHKNYDIPSSFVKKKFSPLYKPSVFKINMYDSSKLQMGIITTRSTRNLYHLIDSEPINKELDEYPPKINYSIKNLFQEIKECSYLTDKGLDLAIYSKELFNSYLNIEVSIPFCCDIIMRMHPNINIKDSFIHSAYSVLNYKYTDIQYSDIEEIWLKIVPIFSVPSGNLFKTRFYHFIDYQKADNFGSNSESPIQLLSKNSPLNKPIILDDVIPNEKRENVKKNYYVIPEARPISNQVKKPKNLSYTGENSKEILDLSYVDSYWDKNNTQHIKTEHDELLNNEYKSLKEKILDIDNELIKIRERLSDPNFVDKNNFFHMMERTLKEDKEKIKERIIHIAGIIAGTEVKYASETGIMIPNNVRKLADLHKINSITHSDILKLKGDDSGMDHSQRIRELEAKINSNNIDMYKIIEIEGNDLDDPRWYSDMNKCLSSFIPRMREVKSLDPTSGIKQFYLVSKDYEYMDSSPGCTRDQLKIYKFVIKDLRKLFAYLNIPMIRIRGKRLESIEREGLIDPRKMEYWEDLHGILYQDNKTACSYIKKFFKKIIPYKTLDLKEFTSSPVFIIWCANHIKSRLGNEDVWRNIFGLIWIIFYTKPFKPRDFVWRNILLV
ncbi:uncharacterized protein cubi_02664 [Cryptosporidium ubiquitum]|uniref:Uncharacterized protein n=1 Tax=Cryptosporidium ubiquitum TaxID=857276 RepID=A0A1J4MKA2_9CRYT|nr:uncharacterized protein cubi_02664 [Cryptosporidium ubiquitum]OII73452.1 hypothetical protein cubi_02664 [Cryptosporidium ubiquitum]